MIDIYLTIHGSGTLTQLIFFCRFPKILKAINVTRLCYLISLYMLFFYKQLFFSTQPYFKMLLRCCLINVTVIKLRHILCLGYLCPCRRLGLFMSCLCNLFFIFSLIFNVINHTTSSKQTHYFWITTWVKKVNSFQKVKVQTQGVTWLLLKFLPISACRCL